MSEYFKELEGLYSKIPGVPCTGCGNCCVTPSVTLVEFVYLMRSLIETRPTEEITELLSRKMDPHPKFAGNHKCRFLSPIGKCTVHPSRPLPCRLHGLPVLEELKLEGMVTYTEMDTTQCPTVAFDTLKSWLNEITDLNQEIYPINEPYWLTGLNIESWLAVYFDDSIDGGIFVPIKKFMIENFDFGFAKSSYRDRTHLKEKLDKIEILYQLQGVADPETVKKLLNSLISDYPRAGTFFIAEAKNILGFLDAPVPQG